MNNDNAELIPYEGDGVDRVNGEIIPAPPPPEAAPSQPRNHYVGIAAAPFSAEAAAILMAPLTVDDIEVRPDGIIYLPEIKYRRILNRAFGPGAWSLRPITINVSARDNMLYYTGALFVLGRFVSEAIGEQQYFPNNDRMSYGTAAEAAKSNCLMRCCKDLGIASELWDPGFTKRWVAENAIEVWCLNIGKGNGSGSKKKMWRKKTSPRIEIWPWREEGGFEPAPIEKSQENRNAAPPVRNPLQPSDRNPPPPARHESARRPDERRSYDARPAANVTVISFPQAKRYKAIATSHGWSDANIAMHMKLHGFQSHQEITRDVYERLCDELQDGVTLQRIRSQGSMPPAAPPTGNR